MKKLKFCFLGDSITEGVGVSEGERYFDEIARKTDVDVFSFGVNGAQTIDLTKQLKKMYFEHGADVDRIFVFAGTNDFNAGISLGRFFTESEEFVPVLYDSDGNVLKREKRKKRSFVLDETTFCGRLNVFFAQLKDLYPLTPVTIMTPLHRGYACFSVENVQQNELYSNKLGLFLDDYVQKVRQCADIYAVNLLDLYRESQLFPLNDDNAKTYFCNVDTDRLHPNAQGHKRIADAIISALKR